MQSWRSDDRSSFHRRACTQSEKARQGAFDSCNLAVKGRAGAQISKLLVRLTGSATVATSSGSTTTGQTLLREVEIKTGEETFGPGDHRFQFLLIVPTTTAVHERSKYGRVWHVLSAVAEASSGHSVRSFV